MVLSIVSSTCCDIIHIVLLIHCFDILNVLKQYYSQSKSHFPAGRMCLLDSRVGRSIYDAWESLRSVSCPLNWQIARKSSQQLLKLCVFVGKVHGHLIYHSKHAGRFARCIRTSDYFAWKSFKNHIQRVPRLKGRHFCWKNSSSKQLHDFNGDDSRLTTYRVWEVVWISDTFCLYFERFKIRAIFFRDLTPG